MLWRTFTLLIFLMLQTQGTSNCDMKTKSIAVIMGNQIILQPIWSEDYVNNIKFDWFVKLASTQEKFKILSLKSNSEVKWEAGQFKNRVHVETKNLTLYINTAQKNDNGLYFLEITSQKGNVLISTCFQVTVFDPVQEPKIDVTGELWNNTLCLVNLFCSDHGNSNLTYTWYRGREQINTSGTHFHLQLHIQAINTDNSYTCNANNSVSSRNHTVNFTWPCSSPELRLPQVLGFSVIPLVIMVLFSILVIVIRKRKKRNQEADMNLTFYEKIHHGNHQRNQVPNETEQGNTFYSVVQFPEQVPASSPSDKDTTVYSTVQFSRHIQKPNRLSRKELEMFHIYS
ncbi:natural killer cell receptor 2B4 isoform X2 [Macrotis lagotis]|uniref:natural killer cell receptor 2B4 isoform X2 n=1 Tax=Macrotis lagotis TaxID=92651 RepID=UPI003D69738F